MKHWAGIKCVFVLESLGFSSKQIALLYAESFSEEDIDTIFRERLSALKQEQDKISDKILCLGNLMLNRDTSIWDWCLKKLDIQI